MDGFSFEAAEALMHDAVDAVLGDVVEVSTAGAGGPWVERKCFIMDEHGVLGLAPIDGLDLRVRIKIASALVPNIGDARFRGGKLGARVWKAGGDQPQHAGRYFAFDLQLTSA